MVCAHARSHRHKALETRCEDAPMTLNTAQACAAWFREEALPFARMYMGNGARVMMCTWHPTTPTSGRLHRRPTPIALPNNLPYAPVRFEFISPDSYPTGTIDHSDPMPEQAWHSAHARLALAQKRTRFLEAFSHHLHALSQAMDVPHPLYNVHFMHEKGHMSVIASAECMTTTNHTPCKHMHSEQGVLAMVNHARTHLAPNKASAHA